MTEVISAHLNKIAKQSFGFSCGLRKSSCSLVTGCFNHAQV